MSSKLLQQAASSGRFPLWDQLPVSVQKVLQLSGLKQEQWNQLPRFQKPALLMQAAQPRLLDGDAAGVALGTTYISCTGMGSFNYEAFFRMMGMEIRTKDRKW